MKKNQAKSQAKTATKSPESKRDKTPKTNRALSALDLVHIWHPCTQMQEHENLPLIPIARAKGVYLYDFDGNRYIDGISSWWVNLFGHGNKRINKAITKQLSRLEHVLLAGFTHEPIIRLSRRLCDKLPPKLEKCFYADNGSSAIEVALKMSFHYHSLRDSDLQDSSLQAESKSATKQAPRKKRTKFLALENAYHGETLGALSVGNVELYKKTYEPLLLECITTPVPKSYNITSAQESKSTQESTTAQRATQTTFTPANLDSSAYFQKELDTLESILQAHGDEICAFILEPLVQCAGEMNMYPRGFAKRACEMCAKKGIHIIFDEIAVGFGRTGSMFALESCGVTPDFLCLSKGITGGYMPLSVVITSQEIYSAFYAPYEAGRAFLHSHSYTGNALACSAANAVLDIFEKEDIIARNAKLAESIAAQWCSIANIKSIAHKVCNIRHCGMIFALDIVSENITNREIIGCRDGLDSKSLDSEAPESAKMDFGAQKGRLESATAQTTRQKSSPKSRQKAPQKRLGLFIFEQALKRGVLLRPLGNTIYFMPPFVISKKQARYVIRQIIEILEMI